MECAMNVSPSPSRLGFVAAGRSVFDFVTEAPYSLWLVYQDEGRIGYEGDDVVLAVLHDLVSYELDIALSRPSVEEEVQHPYTLVDLIRVTDPVRARAYRQFAATTAASVQRGAADLASEFRTYGLEALAGSADFYQEMSAARAEAIRQFGIESADQHARKNAERAWQQRDFQAVVIAYRAMDDRLSRVERERLRYASQRLQA
jgi:hypothetical protein